MNNIRVKKRCPHCGSSHVCRILYGMPHFDEELEKALKEGSIMLGGCMVSSVNLKGENVAIDPAWYCHDCKKAFGRPPYLIRRKENRAEDYREIVTKIRFDRGGYFLDSKSFTITRTADGADAQITGIPCRLPPDNRKHLSREKWQKLLDGLYTDCFLHEWKKSYEDPDVLDGEQWSLRITLEGNRHRSYYGSNAYPVYWKEMLRLFKPYL